MAAGRLPSSRKSSSSLSSGGSVELERGIVRVKPVYVGLYHYNYVYGSVCSPDVVGTPPVPRLTREELEREAARVAEEFRKRLNLDFVRVEEPFVVAEHRDLRRLRRELDYDVDAILLRTRGAVPLVVRTISMLGIPILTDADPDTLRALRVRRFLRESKFLYIGEIPSFSAPKGPWDFAMIEERLGLRAKHIETSEFFRVFDSIPESEAKGVLELWARDFERVIEPSEEDLLNVAKIYLALKRLCEREDANAIAINCGRFTEERPLVPCLAFAKLIDEGVVCACEGDITATISALILHAVSGGPVMMGNFGYRPGMFEAEEGEVTIEHDVLPPSMATGRLVVRDYHGRKFGVTGYADVRREPVTLLNVDASLDKMMVIEGRVRRSEDGTHCRVIVHIEVDGDVERIPEILVGSQHVSMTFGHWLSALRRAGELLGMEVLSLP